MRSLVIGGLAAFFILGQPVQADSMSNKAGINEFAKCSRQCLTDNEKCRKKQQANCKKDEESCFEVCNIAYPDCMAKCPRPGG